MVEKPHFHVTPEAPLVLLGVVMESRTHIFSLSFLFSSLLALILLSSSLPVWADDITNPEGTTTAGSLNGTNSADTITNNGTVASNINAQDGNDTIVNNGTVNGGLNGQAGNDTITNHGTAEDIVAFTGNDTITNHGTINGSINGQDGDDTITNNGTTRDIFGGNDNDTITNNGRVQNDIWGGSGTDSLILEAGSSAAGDINTFENISIKGDTTVGNFNLAGLSTMAVAMSSSTTPVTAGTVTNVTGALDVEITGGAFKNGQAVNIFSTGAAAGFGAETVTESSAIFSFTINNAQVTATRVTTFDALVSGAADNNVSTIAALFEENADTATGNLADVIGTMNFMSAAQLESAFSQMTGLDGNTQAMTQGLRMGSGASMARMASMLAARSTTRNRTGFVSLSALSPTNEQARRIENLRFMKRVSAMISGNSSLASRADSMAFASPDLYATLPASMNIALSVGGLGPSLDLGTGDTGGAWLRALGGRSHQQNRGDTYGYSGETYGLAGGVDKMFSNDILTGVFGSWTRMDMDYNDPGTSKADGNAFQMGLYSAWGPDAWFVETALAATYGAWDSRRRIVAGALDETAESDQDVYGANLAVTIGREGVAGSFIITPVAGLEYTFSHENGYTETGAGALNQTVSSVNRQSLRSMAGGKLERSVLFENENRSYTLTPAIKAQWLHEFLGGEKYRTTYAGMGTTSISSPEPERDTVRLGASLTLAEENRYSSYISYETDIAETYMDHTLAVGIRMAF